ncbi:predicted protein, partial [Postia placenta Mad-698-R]
HLGALHRHAFTAPFFEMLSPLDHCIEMLRQRIMCTGDVGMITFDWVKGHKKPYPNFSTMHVCRKLDNILDWSARHAVDVP